MKKISWETPTSSLGSTRLVSRCFVVKVKLSVNYLLYLPHARTHAHALTCTHALTHTYIHKHTLTCTLKYADIHFYAHLNRQTHSQLLAKHMHKLEPSSWKPINHRAPDAKTTLQPQDGTHHFLAAKVPEICCTSTSPTGQAKINLFKFILAALCQKFQWPY